MNKEYDQLANVLKSAGLVASFYDAANMAKNINEGVQRSESFYKKYSRNSNSLVNQEIQKYNTRPVDTQSQQTIPIIELTPEPQESLAGESLPVESGEEMHLIQPSEMVFSGPVAEAMPPSLELETPVFENPVSETPVIETPVSESSTVLEEIDRPLDGPLNEQIPEENIVKTEPSIFEDEQDVQAIADTILAEKEVDTMVETKNTQEQKVDIDIRPKEMARTQQESAPQVTGMDMQLMLKQMAEQMMQQMMQQQQTQAQALQAQIAEQQKIIQQMASQQAVLKEVSQQQTQPVQQAVQQPQPAKQQQVFTYPPKHTPSESGFFREIPIDRNKPKQGLTKEEQQATDITKWFNFSNRKK